jgi:hypothetical protein
MITENQKQIKPVMRQFPLQVQMALIDPCKQSPIEDRALLQWIWFLVLTSYLARLDVGDDVAEDVADNRPQQ